MLKMADTVKIVKGDKVVRPIAAKEGDGLTATKQLYERLTLARFSLDWIRDVP